MRAARETIVPPMPADLEELGRYLETFPPMKGFFRLWSKTDEPEPSVIIVCVTDLMLKVLKEIAHLLSDGTFKAKYTII